MADINSSLPVTDTADGSTGATAPSTATEVGGVFNTSLPTLTNGQLGSLELDSSGRLLIAPLTNSSIVKAQLQDNAGTAITLGQKTMASSVPVVLSSDQTGINTFLDKNGSGTITALNGNVTITPNGCSNIYLSITGAWVATLTLQGDSGDGTWASLEGVVAFPSGALANVIGSNVSLLIPCGGYKQVRIIATAFTSGTATVTWNAGAGSSSVQVFNNNPIALNAQVVGNVADGAAASGNPVQIGGKDGSGNMQTILTDTAGNQAILLKDTTGNTVAAVNSQLQTRDVLNTSAQYRAQSVTTSAAEALGAGTILANRKLLHITPTNGIIYWGYNSSVTTSNGTPVFPNNTLWLSVTDNVHVFVIAGATTDSRIGEVS